MQKLWLYLCFPQLQLDALLQQNVPNKTAHQAYVILDERTNQICQLDHNAYQAGIRLGMGLGTAAMLKSDLQVIVYQTRINQEILHDIANSLYLLTSDISIHKPHGLLLQIQNMLSMYGGIKPYWQTIKQQLCHGLYNQGLSFSYGTGHSPFAAKILAATSWNKITDNTQVIEQAILPIKLSYTELSSQVIKKLERVGIYDVQSLLNIPLADLAKRFDADVANYIGKLTNQIPHPIQFFHPKKNFERYVELLYDLENIQALLPALGQILDLVERFLKNRDLLTQTLNIELYQREQAPLALEVHSRQGEYLAQRWLALLRLQFENTRLIAPVFAIGVRVHNTYVRSPDKQDLFSPKQGTLSRLQLLSLLQAKLGDQAVFTPSIQNDFRPESMLQVNQSTHKSLKNVKLQAMRPSLLLHHPESLKEKVNIIYGPERIETAWWEVNKITRDYFIAHNAQGQWYWVFKTPANEWFLHGVFS
ncbi:DNA polymerase Y family protein [Paraglaciecola aquimarina]|uniref:DNA polymerase Y family protein n=1 Tax=Paraglaciecola aquimarina TaxID=1235557 RepID=A0ABU3SWJ8_9ALTE|nr:DNA polymerase Y family protein [Paraglaciecola aquimarina]MDU0354363.1 DNA polymerase Y family protein [Paraglaciecola aquimarina]